MSGIAFNAAVSIFARTIGLGIAFFSLGVVTRYLGPEGSGAYFTVLAYVGIWSVVADLGLYPILVRDLGKHGSDEKETFTAFFSLRVVSLTIVLGLASPLTALFLPYTTTVKAGIAIGSAMYIFLSLTTLFVAVYQKYLRMHVVAAGELAGRLVQAVLVFGLLAAGKGVLAALWASLAGSFVHAAVLAWYARASIAYRFSFAPGEWQKILVLSYPVALSTIFSFVYFKIDTVMLSFFASPREVGIYGLAYKLLEVLIAYPAIYVGLLIPSLARAAETDQKRYDVILGKAFRLLALVALPIFFGGIALAADIIPLFGEGYDESVITLQILLGAVMMIFFGTLYANALIVVNRQKTLAAVYFFGMIANILVNLYVIPRWSYLGAAWTTLATEGAVTVSMIWLLHRYGRLSMEFGRVPRMLAACAIMVGGLMAFGEWPLGALLLFGVTVYGSASVMLGAITFEEVRDLFRT